MAAIVGGGIDSARWNKFHSADASTDFISLQSSKQLAIDLQGPARSTEIAADFYWKFIVYQKSVNKAVINNKVVLKHLVVFLVV